MIAPLRLISFSVLLALSACAGGTGSADLSPAAAPPPQQSAAVPAPPPQEPMTPEKAKADCWMKYESDKKVKNIDQRLTLVEKCVDETMRGQLVQRPQR
jgi:ABC-type glycerol-3-phosphate transport system substrate-binding protein